MAATGKAEAAWHAHRDDCTTCSVKGAGLCPDGRELLHHLWACQSRQSDAWHSKPLKGAGMDPLF